MRRIEHRIAANGLKHFVRDSGPEDAPVAVLLHGFPDSGALWDGVTPALVAAGFRVIAPDMRGFGRTDMAPHVADYDIRTGAAPDVHAICDQLDLRRVHLVGHDFGAPVAWFLAAHKPDLFASLTALSVGHMRAFLHGGLKQKLMSWYVVLHQFRGLAEFFYRANDWAFLRRYWEDSPGVEARIEALSEPGRLTAGLNWYRANISLTRMARPPAEGAFGDEIVRIPTLGVWSDRDRFLDEPQMKRSAAYVDAPWTYRRIEGAGHWMMEDAPDETAALLIDHWRAAG